MKDQQLAMVILGSHFWLNDNDEMKEESEQISLDCKHGICSGHVEMVPLKKGAKIDQYAIELLPEKCVRTKPVAWVYEDCFYDEVYYPLGCAHDIVNALVQRQLKDVECIEEDEIDDLVRYTKYFTNEILKLKTVNLMSQSAWVNTLRKDQQFSYAGSKFEEYTNQFLLGKRSTLSKCFIKKEAHFKPVFIPRHITGKQDDYNITLGKYTKTASKIFSHVLSFLKHKQNTDLATFDITALNGKIVYANGMNRDELGDFIHDIYIKYNNPKFLSTDYKKFDSHISNEYKLLEQILFNYMFPNNGDIQNILNSQRKTRGFSCNRSLGERWYYEVEGTRSSGDQNTSIGNSYINIMIQLYVLNKQVDILKLLEQDRCRIIFTGDDTLIIMDDWCIDKEQYEYDMLKVGMEVKSEITDIYSATFLSGCFVPATRCVKNKFINTHLHIPLIGKNLQKAYISIHKYKGYAQKAWIKQNALNYARNYSCVIPMQVWHKRVYSKYSTVTRSAPKTREYSLNTAFDYVPTIERVNESATNITNLALQKRYNINEKSFTNWTEMMKSNKLNKTDETVLRIIDVDLNGKGAKIHFDELKFLTDFNLKGLLPPFILPFSKDRYDPEGGGCVEEFIFDVSHNIKLKLPVDNHEQISFTVQDNTVATNKICEQMHEVNAQRKALVEEEKKFLQASIQKNRTWLLSLNMMKSQLLNHYNKVKKLK